MSAGRGRRNQFAETTMDSVVQLVNRLQSAATKLGDNAASDKSLPSLWELLPSIVVIGGQVCLSSACRSTCSMLEGLWTGCSQL